MKILLVSQYAKQLFKGLIPSNTIYRLHFINYHLKVYQTLLELGHDVILTDGIDNKELIDKIILCDLVFPIRHDYGYVNGDLLIRLLCKKYNKKCIGSDISSRFYDTDKVVGKLLCKRLQIPTPDYFLPYQINCPTFNGPYLLKPRFGASSSNMTDANIFERADEINKKLEKIKNPECFFIEKFIVGVTATIGCLLGEDNQTILGEPYALTSKNNRIITLEDKRNGGCIRSRINEKKVIHNIKDYAKAFFKEIQPCQIARLDFMLTDDNKLFFWK